MIHAFIDTNMFLSFYKKTDNRIEQLTRVLSLIEDYSIKLYVSQQLVDEFTRSRDKVLNDQIKELDKFSVRNVGLPRFLEGFTEAATLLNSHAALSAALEALLKLAEREARNRKLPTDDLVGRIFSAVDQIPNEESIFRRASKRMQLGNPPGKDNSLGDAVHWENLLNNVPTGNDLHIISNDGDFRSPLDDSQPHELLANEWRSFSGNQTLYVHRTLRSFLNVVESVPESKSEVRGKDEAVPAGLRDTSVQDKAEATGALVDNAIDFDTSLSEEKLEKLIDEFLVSASFVDTHRSIRSIESVVRTVRDIPDADRAAMLAAARSNNQIYFIRFDADVSQFLNSLLQASRELMTPTEFDDYVHWLNP